MKLSARFSPPSLPSAASSLRTSSSPSSWPTTLAHWRTKMARRRTGSRLQSGPQQRKPVKLGAHGHPGGSFQVAVPGHPTSRWRLPGGVRLRKEPHQCRRAPPHQLQARRHRRIPRPGAAGRLHRTGVQPRLSGTKADTSYGLGSSSAGATLVSLAAPARALVPTNGSMGLTWTQVASTTPPGQAAPRAWAMTTTRLAWTTIRCWA